MFDFQLSFWIQIGISLCIFALVVLVFVWKYTSDYYKVYSRPIVCICEVNGRIGVVLRRDYDEASRRYWKEYLDGKHYDAGHVSAPDGRRLKVEPLFNFRAWSAEYYTLCCGCYVERAIFEVPAVYKNQPCQLAEAYEYFHGKPWDGEIIHW